MNSIRLNHKWNQFKRELKIYQCALADPRTPRIAKWLLSGAVAYALSPVDFIPDFIPVLGYLDDAVIIPLLVMIAVRCIPKAILEDCRQKANSSDLPK